MRTPFRAGFALLLCSLLAARAATAGPAPTAPVYNFSPVNQYNLQVSASFWNPIVRYV